MIGKWMIFMRGTKRFAVKMEGIVCKLNRPIIFECRLSPYES